MSLAEKWNNHLKEILESISPNGIEKQEFDRIKAAFYAGAEAYKDAKDSALNSFSSDAIDAEIDNFRSHK